MNTTSIFKRFCLVAVFLFLGSVQAQQRYLEELYTDVEVKTFAYSDTLKLDVYSPKKDKITDRPLLLLVHGGGFAGGKRYNPLEKKFSSTMAKKGYVVASMSYRLVRKGLGFGCNTPAKEKLETFRLATEDVLKATNYLIQKSDVLGFDPNEIILIGSSAGAEAVLNTVFMRYHRAFKDLPYGKTHFAGVISFSGAIVNVEYITRATALPTLLFHGAKDNLVPFASAPHHFCEDNSPGFLPLDGSKSIAKKLSDLGMSVKLYQDPNGNHDWANLSFAYTNEVALFIKGLVLDGLKEHATITVTTNPK